MTLSDVVRENEDLKRKCERMTEILTVLEKKARKLEEMRKENEVLKKKVEILTRALEIAKQAYGEKGNLDLGSILEELKALDRDN